MSTTLTDRIKYHHQKKVALMDAQDEEHAARMDLIDAVIREGYIDCLSINIPKLKRILRQTND